MPNLRTSVRARLKRSAELLLSGAGAARAARWYRRRGTLVLAYHNVVPHGEPRGGDRSLHLPQREFASQLELIGRTHEVVPLERLAEPRSGGRPRAVITFDDAYEGAVTAGVHELARRGMPATVFVAPAFVGGRSFWWDVLADPDRGLEPSFRDRALARLRGEDEEIRGWAARAGMEAREVAPHMRAATESRLADAVRAGGITLASHTWSHPNLAALDAEALEREMERPLRWLRERFGAALPWLSYPYGLSSPAVEDAARRAGYTGAFRVEGGWLLQDFAGAPRFALPRVNVPAGGSLEYFSLLTSGLLAR